MKSSFSVLDHYGRLTFVWVKSYIIVSIDMTEALVLQLAWKFALFHKIIPIYIKEDNKKIIGAVNSQF